MLKRENHPRPDMMRETCIDLNGAWNFAFDDADQGLKECWFDPAHAFDMTIQVPFCYQCKSSGIGDTDYHRVVWYARKVNYTPASRLLVRFGAVDDVCQVFVNGHMVCEHQGGYLPFTADVTPYWHEGENDLRLRVVDDFDRSRPRGKQHWDLGVMGCWYTPVTGIWQNVYMEEVGCTGVERVHVTPNMANHTAEVMVELDREALPGTTLTLRWGREGKPASEMTVSAPTRRTSVSLDVFDRSECWEVQCWSPRNPVLYDLTVEVKVNGEAADLVSTYFGMREVKLINGAVYLNRQRIYQRLILDQGYWPDSLLTPPSGEALKTDVEWTLRYGFNGARKHQKIEDPRYYYWADKLGMLVWGEVPSAYDYTPAAVCRTADTLSGFIDRDYNHPCIITWVPINESWGVPQISTDAQQQHAASMLYHLAKASDTTRLISGNDGWEQVRTDICALHDYAGTYEKMAGDFVTREKVEAVGCDEKLCWAEGNERTGKEAFMVTEWGGIAFTNKGLQGNVDGMESWGYNDKVSDEETYYARYKDLVTAIHELPYCEGECFTQLTDVMQEVNGLLSPDRQPKVDPDRIARINRDEE